MHSHTTIPYCIVQDCWNVSKISYICNRNICLKCINGLFTDELVIHVTGINTSSDTPNSTSSTMAAGILFTSWFGQHDIHVSSNSSESPNHSNIFTLHHSISDELESSEQLQLVDVFDVFLVCVFKYSKVVLTDKSYKSIPKPGQNYRSMSVLNAVPSEGLKVKSIKH